jgi:hypothetical protein
LSASDAPATAAQELCAGLAGVRGISARLAESALAQGRDRFGSAVDELLQTFARGGLEAVQGSELAGVARALTYFLYTGVLPDADGAETGHSYERGEMSAEDYFESQVWRVVQAHPRALSGGYYGHWHYPPEDDDGAR